MEKPNYEIAVKVFLSLPYVRVTVPDPNGKFHATILEFDCFADASTPQEAIEGLEITAAAWIESNLQKSIAIPPVDTGSQRWLERLKAYHGMKEHVDAALAIQS